MATKKSDNKGGKAAKPAKGGKQPAGQQAGGSKKKGGAGQARQARVQREHSGVELAVPAPRLKGHYNTVVKARLAERFGYTNPHMVPTVEKIVINVGLGEAVKQPKLLDTVVEEIGIITGQRPVKKKARKSVANFQLREGQEIGVAVTLRGNRMWEFLDRLITLAIPRIRDFRGLPKKLDGRGNYTMGLSEQSVFPEIQLDKVEFVQGMDITFVTNAPTDKEGFALLTQLGMPFQKESDKN